MSPDGVATPEEAPHDPWMDARVTRLEDDMGEIKATLRRLEPMIMRIDATLPHLATKADLMGVRTELKEETAALRLELKTEISSVRTELASVRTELKTEIGSVRTELKTEIGEVKIALADKPSRTYMWGIMTAMIAAFACGLAGLAIVK